nr:ribonuclease H-like domain-containing protein [Tanacetum cinerariifolium]
KPGCIRGGVDYGWNNSKGSRFVKDVVMKAVELGLNKILTHPPGLINNRYPYHVCLLQRSLYGLKQAPRAWFQRFAGYANELDFIIVAAIPHYLYIGRVLRRSRLYSSLSMLTWLLVTLLRHPLIHSLKWARKICLYMHDPRESHFAALKRILRYVRGTVDFGLHLYVSATTTLVGYTNADWAGCPSTCKSTSGYCVFLRDNLLSWSAKRKHTISRSSAEAEYQGIANVVAETAWVRNLLRELHSHLMTATLVYYDNVSAVYMSANPIQHQWTKHIEIDIHFVRDMVTAGHVLVLYVPSHSHFFDIFTKGLPSALFEDFAPV